MMRALTGQEILYIWDSGQGQHSLDRALTMLLVAFPETTRDTLALLSIGQRDTLPVGRSRTNLWPAAVQHRGLPRMSRTGGVHTEHV